MIWYYIAGIVAAPPDTPGLGGVGYFSYVLVGLPIFHCLVSDMTAFSTKVRNEQMTGTLEALSRFLPITYALRVIRRGC